MHEPHDAYMDARRVRGTLVLLDTVLKDRVNLVHFERHPISGWANLYECIFAFYVSFLPYLTYGRGVCKANGRIMSRKADRTCMLVEEASLMTSLLLVECRAQKPNAASYRCGQQYRNIFPLLPSSSSSSSHSPRHSFVD